MTPENREPFWTYRDVALFLGLGMASIVTGSLLAKGVFALAGIQVAKKAFELFPAQFLGYLLMFLGLNAIFKLHYSAPFWRSLGWIRPQVPVLTCIALGYLLAFTIAVLGYFLRIPDVQSPMKDLLSDRTSFLIAAVAGVTVGPIAEELVFRGFMQPLFVRSFGALAGILLAAVPFGLLHVPQYGNSWRHGLLIVLAGAAFGWMRHVSRSTLGSTLMHSAYNLALFTGFLYAGKDLPQTW